jgi:hypothetical protein
MDQYTQWSGHARRLAALAGGFKRCHTSARSNPETARW